MIIKLDHITFVSQRSQKESILNSAGGKLAFSEENLRNLNIKRGWMKRNQDTHDLFYYEDNWPTEYVFYDEVEARESCELSSDVLHGSYNDKDEAALFLKALFGDKKVHEDGDEIVCNMRGILDKRDYLLILRKKEKPEPIYLDMQGYGCICLMSNTSGFDQIRGCNCTESEDLRVNGRNLDICFLTHKSVDMIFEIIKMKGEK